MAHFESNSFHHHILPFWWEVLKALSVCCKPSTIDHPLPRKNVPIGSSGIKLHMSISEDDTAILVAPDWIRAWCCSLRQPWTNWTPRVKHGLTGITVHGVGTDLSKQTLPSIAGQREKAEHHSVGSTPSKGVYALHEDYSFSSLGSIRTLEEMQISSRQYCTLLHTSLNKAPFLKACIYSAQLLRSLSNTTDLLLQTHKRVHFLTPTDLATGQPRLHTNHYAPLASNI